MGACLKKGNQDKEPQTVAEELKSKTVDSGVRHKSKSIIRIPKEGMNSVSYRSASSKTFPTLQPQVEIKTPVVRISFWWSTFSPIYHILYLFQLGNVLIIIFWTGEVLICSWPWKAYLLLLLQNRLLCFWVEHWWGETRLVPCRLLTSCHNSNMSSSSWQCRRLLSFPQCSRSDRECLSCSRCISSTSLNRPHPSFHRSASTV